jgi:L-lactate dehydrogenase
MLHGEYGIEDVCLSLQAFVSEDGVAGRLIPKMTDEEVEQLKASAAALKEVIASVEI